MAYFFSNISNIRKQMVRDSYYCDLDFKYTPAMASYILDDQIEGPETLFGTALDLQTRKYLEIEKKDTLVQYIKKTNDITILKYLYYEYFKEECTKITLIKQKILKIVRMCACLLLYLHIVFMQL